MRDIITPIMKLFNVEVKVAGSVQKSQTLDFVIEEMVDVGQIFDDATL